MIPIQRRDDKDDNKGQYLSRLDALRSKHSSLHLFDALNSRRDPGVQSQKSDLSNVHEDEDEMDPEDMLGWDMDDFHRAEAGAKMGLIMGGMHKVQRIMKKNRERIRKLYQNTNVDMKKIEAKFQEFDEDGSGSIDKDEFKNAMVGLGVPLSDHELTLIWRRLDPENDGDITIDEFTDLLKFHIDACPGAEIGDLVRSVMEREKDEVMKLVAVGKQNYDNEALKLFDFWDVDRFAPYPRWPKDTCGRLLMNLHFTMEDEEYSDVAFYTFCFVMSLIIISTLAFVCETIPEWELWIGWTYLEYIVSISFTVEFALRLISCRNAYAFWKPESFYLYDYLNIVDLLAIVPFYMEIFMPGAKSEVIRVIRVVRLVRIARLRRFESMQRNAEIVGYTLSKSYDESFSILAMLILVECLVFSSFVFVFEKGKPYMGCTGKRTTTMELCQPRWGDGLCRWKNGECIGVRIRSNGEPSPFTSIPVTMWWTMTTMTTVGYGDMAPIERLGMFLGSLTMLTGVVVVSIFVVVIAGNFDRAQQRVKAAEQLKKKTRKVGLTLASPSSNSPFAREKAIDKVDDKHGSREASVSSADGYNTYYNSQAGYGKKEESLMSNIMASDMMVSDIMADSTMDSLGLPTNTKMVTRAISDEIIKDHLEPVGSPRNPRSVG